MGIDAQAFTKELPKSLFVRLSPRKALTKIEGIAEKYLREKGFGPLYSITCSSSHQIIISLLPICEPLTINVSENGLRCEFRSSNAGPGFHAECIELLSHIANACKLNWIWGIGVNCTDETGYAINQDFSALQIEMAHFFRTLMVIIEENDEPGLSFCIPEHLLQKTGINGPFGPIDASYLRHVLNADDHHLQELADQHFVWWRKDRDASFWQKILRTLLWQNAFWRSPVSDREEETVEQIRFAAKTLKDITGTLPTDLQTTLTEFETSLATDMPPTNTGIGYLRNPVRITPFSGWTIYTPGYLRFYDEGDTSSYMLTHKTMTVRLSSTTAGISLNQDPGWPDMFDNCKEGARDGLTWRTNGPHNEDNEWISYVSLFKFVSSNNAHYLQVTTSLQSAEQEKHLTNILSSVSFDEAVYERI